MKMKKILFALMSSFLLMSCFAGENDFLRPVGKPPRAKAQRRQGGEAFPPLPLPVTPLRRSEKKRPPSPGVLICKVIWGKYLDYKWKNGVVTRVFDWNMVPADCSRLLRFVKSYTKMEYKVQTLDLNVFSGNPSEVPVLYFSGGRSVNFTPAELLKLRRYLKAGGMIWFDSVVGSPYFYKSALKVTREILPESSVKRLAPDHPVFRLVKPLNSAQVNNGKYILPTLDGAYIGSRLAVVISPYGMGGGWDNTYPQLIKQAKFYKRYPAICMGVNLAAYAVGWSETGRRYASRERFDGSKNKNPDKIVFAQLRSSGIWDANPGAASRFMRYLAQNVSIQAGAEPVYVSAAKIPLDNYPFLYFTGIGHFKFSAAEISKVREYLNNGGFLFINNAMGLNEFNYSVIKAVKSLYPTEKLKEISAKDPMFAAAPFKFTASGFTPEAAEKFRGRTYPLLYGLKGSDDRYKIIYSPVDLAGGWQGAPGPGSVAYKQNTALKLGADIITYILTH